MAGLAQVRENLQSLIPVTASRPFLCEGDPRSCEVMVVGFNAATSEGLNVWDHWSDETGCDLHGFMAAYRVHKPVRGVRLRLERLREGLHPIRPLETNIHPTPSRRAADLRKEDRSTEFFEKLFDLVQPKLIFAHSNKPIEYFKQHTNIDAIDGSPKKVCWRGHDFWIAGRPGPLWRAKGDGIFEMGSTFASFLRNQDQG